MTQKSSSSFATRFALHLTGWTTFFFVCLIGFLSYYPNHTNPTDQSHTRRLAVEDAHSAINIFETPFPLLVIPLFFSLTILYLLLLFRMLASTAEDYFSPPLEMFSYQLHLPPRLAGVTLLALGNGASDVASTIKSMTLDPEHGYEMSIGALTGAGMFVSTIISALVIRTSPQGFVHCRGAFIREVSMYFGTNLLLWIYLGGSLWHRQPPSQSQQKMGQDDAANIPNNTTAWIDFKAIHIWTLFYLFYIGMVLFADIYHRIKTRRELLLLAPTIQASNQRQDEIQEASKGLKNPSEKGSSSPPRTPPSPNRILPPNHQQQHEETMGLMSSYTTTTRTIIHDHDGRDTTIPLDLELELEDDEVDDTVRQQLILYGSQGFLNRHPLHHHLLSAAPTMYQSDSGSPTITSTPYISINDGGIPTTRPSLASFSTAWDRLRNNKTWNIIPPDNNNRVWMNVSYSTYLRDAYQELKLYFRDQWLDIIQNEDYSLLDKILLVLEFPFTVLRQLTIPIPCEGIYCKSLVAVSISIAPVWLGFYLFNTLHVNLFLFGGFPYIELATLVSSLLGFFILRYAPSSDGSPMSIFISAPIALFGFFMAATWIDVIAGYLVSSLTLLGSMFHIPKTIMGVTVLALGNSMSDLSADVALAKKGLANMAITACFAGPMFNILIGLSAGFSSLLHISKNESIPVVLTASNNLGFLFIMAHCLIILCFGLVYNKGFLPSSYGYVAIAIYGIYIIFCLVEGKDYTVDGNE